MTEPSRIDEVKPMLVYSEIYGQKPTVQIAKTYLGRLNKTQFLSFVCALSAIMHNNAGIAMMPDWQAEAAAQLASALGVNRVLREIRTNHGVLVHELQLGLLACYAMKYCTVEPTVGDFADVALRLLLIVNELNAEVLTQGEASSPQQSLFRTEVQSAILLNERLAHLLQRYYRLFQWFDALPSTAEDWLPLRKDFERLLSISAEEYLTASFCVLSHFLAIKNAANLSSHPPYFSFSHFGSTLKDRKVLDHWINRFAITAEELAESVVEPTFTAADIKLLIERPLLIVGRDSYFCPLPSLLEDTLNTRVYFTLFAAYEDVDGLDRAKRFSRLQGHFLENYVRILIEKIVKPEYAVLGEIRYAAPGGHRKSTDVVAIRPSDGSAAFIEVTKTRFRLAESLFALDEAAVMNDLDSMVIRKAAQIQRSLNDLAENLYSYSVPIHSVAPVVVTGQGIPGLIYLKHCLEERLQKRKLLQDTEPLLYCDVEELEGLALMDPGNVDLFKLLVEKARHPDILARAQSLKNYLHYYRLDISRKNQAYDTVFPELEEAMESVIKPTLQAWGMDVTLRDEQQ